MIHAARLADMTAYVQSFAGCSEARARKQDTKQTMHYVMRA